VAADTALHAGGARPAYADRIAKMRAEGLLTDAQAEALRASLAPLAQNRDLRRGQARAVGTLLLVIGIAGAALVAALLIIGLLGGGGNEIQNVSETLNVPGGTGGMNKTLSTLASTALLLLPVVLIVVAFAWFYNRIVDKEERVYEAWSQVESNLQRRADLIPNLVETVSRYLKHERETLVDVADERGDALAPLADAMNELIAERQRAAEQAGGPGLDDEAEFARLAQAQELLGGSLKKLVAVAESYPNLRSADQFLALQAQLEGTENRINVARMEFNGAVGDYNSAIRRLPGSLVAGLGDFKRKAYFQAEDDAKTAAEVGFEQD
jgi:LemA protein